MKHLLRFLLPALVLLAGLPLCLGVLSRTLGDRAAAESLTLVEENVRRAAVSATPWREPTPRASTTWQSATAWPWTRAAAGSTTSTSVPT